MDAMRNEPVGYLKIHLDDPEALERLRGIRIFNIVDVEWGDYLAVIEPTTSVLLDLIVKDRPEVGDYYFDPGYYDETKYVFIRRRYYRRKYTNSENTYTRSTDQWVVRTDDDRSDWGNEVCLRSAVTPDMLQPALIAEPAERKEPVS